MDFLQLGRWEEVRGEVLAASPPAGGARGTLQRNEPMSLQGVSKGLSPAKRDQNAHGGGKELAGVVFNFF